MNTLILPSGRGEARERALEAFSQTILDYNRQASQAMSSRGWCYFLEGFNVLTKGDFSKAQKAINECRKRGYLPIDFTAADPKRTWQGVERPESLSPEQYLRSWLESVLTAEDYYIPDWWEGEQFYLQMMVEKIDLVNLFSPLCREYHMPLVNGGGWSDITERAEAAARFLSMEERGLRPVLLYFGDFDPWGNAISDFLADNFRDIAGGTHWWPDDLIVQRFGLNFDFIEAQGLTWIDNLESGSGKDMAQCDNRIVRDYVASYGERKCEANAVMRVSAREPTMRLLRDIIEGYLGSDALDRFAGKREGIRERLQDFRDRIGLTESINRALLSIDAENSTT